MKACYEEPVPNHHDNEKSSGLPRIIHPRSHKRAADGQDSTQPHG